MIFTSDYKPSLTERLIQSNYPQIGASLTPLQVKHIENLKAELDARLKANIEAATWNAQVKRRNKRFTSTGLNKTERKTHYVAVE